MQQEAQQGAAEAARQKAEAEKASAAALAQQAAAQARRDQARQDVAPPLKRRSAAAEAETEKARQAAAQAEPKRLSFAPSSQSASIPFCRPAIPPRLIVNMSDFCLTTGSYHAQARRPRKKLAKNFRHRLSRIPAFSLQIEGHTDSVGGDESTSSFPNARRFRARLSCRNRA